MQRQIAAGEFKAKCLHLLDEVRQSRKEIVITKRGRAVARLLHRFADQEMQLADACVVRLSELHEDCVVLTTDLRDFSVYRRFERQRIPFLAPQSE